MNGAELGQHEGGFTPFDFEITDRLRPEGNFVVVRVNNVRAKDQVPTVNTDWWNYGGITRPVTLVELPATFIQDYSVQLEKGSTKRIKGWVQLDGAQLSQSVTVRIPEAKIIKTLQTDAHGRVEFVLDNIDLDLWSPENPQTVLRRSGRRNRSRGRQNRIPLHRSARHGFLLNGKSIFLRGISIHEEKLPRGAAAPGAMTTPARFSAGRKIWAAISSPGPLPSQRSHGPHGGPNGRAGLGRSAGLLDHPVGESRHLTLTRKIS